MDWEQVAVGTAGDAISGIADMITFGGSGHSQRKTFRSNTDYLHKINIEDAKNKYLYELEALHKAGINTAMINGGAGSSAGVASSSGAPADIQQPHHFDFTSGVSKAVQAKQLEKQTDSQVHLNESSSDAQDAKARLDNAEAQRVEMTQEVFLRQMYSTLYNTAAQTQWIKSQTDYTDQQRENASFDLFSNKVKLDDTLRNLKLTGDELDARIRQIGTDISIKQQMLPLNLQLLRAQAFQAFQAGNLSKEQIIVCQRTCKVLDEQYEEYQNNNKITRETMDSMIALINARNDNDYSEELIRDVKLSKFLSDPKKLAQMSEAEFEKEFNEVLYGAYIAKGDYNSRWSMKQLRRINMVTQAVGNVVGVNMGYGNFKSTNINATPKSPGSSLLLPQQGGTYLNPLSNQDYQNIFYGKWAQ